MRSKSLRSVLMLAFVFAFSVGSALAQSGTIKGTITDAQTSQTVIGANVYIQSLNKGAPTDTDGSFTIANVPYGEYTLRVSYIGYITKKISVTVDQSTVTVNTTLKQSTAQLENLVVTALGQQETERSLGYSVQQVSGEDIAQTHETNFINSLQGKVAGAQIGSSPTLGGSSRILLRGITSLTGNNQPLFVVDGIPVDNSNFANVNEETGRGGYDFGNAISSIDPNNIKSVTVLKGASASALYGSRGANGVIRIETKDGSNQQGIGVSLSSGVTFNQVYELPNYQNKYGGGSSSSFIQQNGELFVDYGTDESWGPRLDGRPVRQWYSFDDVNGLNGKATPWVAHPDNVKDYFNTGVLYNNNISLSSGGDTYSYHLSLTRQDQTGVQPESNLNRKKVGFAGRANFSDKFSANVSGHFSYDDARGRPGTGYDNINVFQQFNQFGQRQVDFARDSYISHYQRPDGTARGWNWAGVDGARGGMINYSNGPYWIRNKNYEKDDTQRLYGKVGLTYDFTDYLSLNGQVKTDYYTDRRETRIAVGSQATSHYDEDLREVQETNAQARLSFTKSLNQDFTLDAFLGGNVRYNNYSRNDNSTNGGLSTPGIYTIENSIARPTLDDYYSQQRRNSALGQFKFGFDDMLYLTLNGRNEWSSTLPEDNNSFFYYSATGSWIFTDLDAFNDNNVLSFGKIRVGYSKTGNSAPVYSTGTSYPLIQPFGSTPQLSVSNTLNNPNLVPEQTYSWEVGANFKFFNDRIGLDATYYSKKSKDQIIPIDVSTASGYARQFVNAGELDNKGLEVSLNLTPLQLDNGLQWDINLNWAKNVNSVEKLTDRSSNYLINTAPFGVSVNAREGETYGTIIGSDFKYDDNGNKIISDDGYYETVGNQVLGSYLPDWQAGASTSIRYKGFTFMVAVDGQKGGDVYSISNMFGKYSGILEVTARDNIREAGVIADGVNEDGSTNTARVDAKPFFKQFYGVNAADVYDASYIKLREVRLAYSIPATTFGNTPIRGITIAAQGRNLAILFKNAPNFDPSTVVSANNFQGVEAGRNPSQRAYGLSVQLDF